MPKRAKKPCAHAGCRALTKERWCPRHKVLHVTDRVKRYNEARPESDRLYHTGRWQKIRRAKMRDNPLCEDCERRGRVNVGVMVDHIHPVRDGGEMFDYENLQTLCDDCHREKTSIDIRERR